MRFRIRLGALAGLTALAGCVGPLRQENAALRMSWPVQDPKTLAAAAPAPAYPSISGDLLQGTSPARLAASRAAAADALTQALARP